MKDFLEFFRDKSTSEYQLIFIVPSKIVIYLYIWCVLQSNLIKIAHRLIYQIYIAIVDPFVIIVTIWISGRFDCRVCLVAAENFVIVWLK